MDLVTHKWITEIVSGEETSLQVQLAFTHALELEGLLERIDAHQIQLADPTVDDPDRPVLLAVSDNGPQMTSGSTREFLAMCAIAQHFGEAITLPTPLIRLHPERIVSWGLAKSRNARTVGASTPRSSRHL